MSATTTQPQPGQAAVAEEGDSEAQSKQSLGNARNVARRSSVASLRESCSSGDAFVDGFETCSDGGPP